MAVTETRDGAVMHSLLMQVRGRARARTYHGGTTWGVGPQSEFLGVRVEPGMLDAAQMGGSGGGGGGARVRACVVVCGGDVRVCGWVWRHEKISAIVCDASGCHLFVPAHVSVPMESSVSDSVRCMCAGSGGGGGTAAAGGGDESMGAPPVASPTRGAPARARWPRGGVRVRACA